MQQAIVLTWNWSTTYRSLFPIKNRKCDLCSSSIAFKSGKWFDFGAMADFQLNFIAFWVVPYNNTYFDRARWAFRITAADKVFDDQWSWKKTRGIESWEVSQGTFIRSETRGARNTGDTARKAASKREIVHRLRWMDEAERIDVWSVFYNPIILVDLSGFPRKLRHGCAVKSSVVINGKAAAPIVFRFLEWSADGRLLTETTRWIAYRR